MSFKDFRLQIIGFRAGGGHAVHVDSPSGEDTAVFVPPTLPAGENLLGTSLARSCPPARHLRTHPTEEPQLTPEVIGEQLFSALFPNTILGLYERSIDQIPDDSKAGLRIKLVLNPKDPGSAALQALPWELMCRPGTNEFLALSRRQPFVRYLEVPRPVHAAPYPNPFRIVAIASNPDSAQHGPLDLDRELKNLRNAVNGVAEIVTPEAPTLSALRETLRASECHAIHFMGHGGMVPGKNEGALLFTSEDGHERPISGAYLLNTIRDWPSVRLVVLNACQSASSVAISLVLGGVPAVIAMQHAISDEAAIAFSREFYRSLSVDPVDAAVAEGRQAIYLQDSDSFEWATPVLFMRTPTGELYPQEDIPPSQKLGQLARSDGGMLPEVKINFVGLWKGSWENLVKSKRGEEIINVEWQENGEIGGYFFDTSEDSFIIEFEGEFRGGNLFVKYRAREGEMIMQVGCCCLRLRDDRTLEGHYADFSGCGTYELKLIGYTGASLPPRPAQLPE